jgi:hypothetical protein
MSTYEVTYHKHTELPPERIEALGHDVDDTTTPPTHRFHVLPPGATAGQPIERIHVESVRELD